MKQLFENITLDSLVKKKRTSPRTEIVKQLYELYSHPSSELHTKKENWKRYIQYLRDNRRKDSKDEQAKFRKSKIFLTTKTPKEFAIYLSIVPTEDLYYMLSIAKDKYHRGESVPKYLIGSVKPKKI